MMKKKTHESEDNKQKNRNNQFDNKENTKTPESNEINNSGDQDTLESVEPANDTMEANAGTADKVIPEVRALEEKLAEMQDKYIRLSAEFDNYRKRTLREKMEISRYAGEDLLLKIIPIMDDFDRALMHMENSSDESAMKAGIDLIYSKFGEFLKQNGIKEIPSLNSEFNVDLHEAVAKVPVDDDSLKGKVVDVVLKGYYLQDKVLRFSKVVVGE
jgi:molecular chaperone GrpE